MNALILVNASAGFVAANGPEDLGARLQEAAGEIGWSCEVKVGPCDDLIEAARTNESADVIICAGGDGTIAAVAAVVAEAGATFLPLPCGTMNLFCRDLGLPADPIDALKAALQGSPVMVDLGTVETEEDGKRVFLNNIVFGPYADLAVAREKMRDAETVAETGAAIIDAASALIGSTPGPHAISIDDRSIALDTNTVVISNNCYSQCIDLAPRRSKLDGGVLCLYLVSASGPASFAARLIEFLDGTLDKSENIDLYTGLQCVVERRDGPTVFAVDGERRETNGDVKMRILPGALRILVPRAADRPSTTAAQLVEQRSERGRAPALEDQLAMVMRRVSARLGLVFSFGGAAAFA